MKRQKGALKLQGSHGDFTFAQTKNGFIWKEKAPVDKARKINERIVNNFTEFGTAGRAVKLLRDAFRDQVKYAKDRLLTSRLQTLMLKAIKGDIVSKPGERNAANGDLAMLEGFQCNAKAIFRDTLGQEYSNYIDRAAGKTGFSVPAFVPKQSLTVPEGSTHFRIDAACSEIDFTNGKHATNSASTGWLPIDDTAITPIALVNLFTAGSQLPVFLAAGIRFVEIVNGYEQQISGGEHSALCFVQIDNS